MTFDEIVSKVRDRLNLTSPASLARVQESVNEIFRMTVSSCGLQTSVRSTAEADTTIGSRYVVFGGLEDSRVEKLFDVFDGTLTPPRVLVEVSFNELRNSLDEGDFPTQYAVARMGPDSVTIFLSGTPTAVVTWSADVEENSPTMSGSDEPAFAESFHDLLIPGAMAIELDKMEKPDLAVKQEKKWEKRVAELRLFIAASSSREIYQGKRSWRGLVTPMVQG